MDVALQEARQVIMAQPADFIAGALALGLLALLIALASLGGRARLRSRIRALESSVRSLQASQEQRILKEVNAKDRERTRVSASTAP